MAILYQYITGHIFSLSIPFLVNFDKPDLSLKVADYPSIILLAMTLGCLEYTLEEGARWGWLDDNTILLTSVLALVSFYFICCAYT